VTQPKVVLGVTIDDSLQFLNGYPEFLVARGWQVHIVSGPGPRLNKLRQCPGVSTYPMKMRRRPGPFEDLLALARWILLIRRVRPNAVSVGTPKAGLLGTLAAFVMRVPVRVYLLRGLRLETSTGLRRSILTAIEKLAMRSATDIVAISPSLRLRAIDLRLVSPDKIRVVGHGSSNGVDTENFDSRRFSNEDLNSLRERIGLVTGIPTIGFVGRLTRDKGLFDLSEAMRLLSVERASCQLLVVGGVDDVSGSEALKTLSSLDIPVTVVGHVDNPAAYYAVMDIFCLPSFREGFGNAVVEASSMGVPVVISDATGIIDTIDEGRTGISTPVGDPAQLAEGLRRILSDPAFADELGSNGRAWVRARFARKSVQQNYADDLATTVALRFKRRKGEAT